MYDTTTLLGQSNINYAAKNEPVRFSIGNEAFVTVGQKRKNYIRYKKGFSSTILYTLNNTADKVKTVRLLVPFYRTPNTTIQTKQSFKYEDGNKIVFEVKVQPQQKKAFEVCYQDKGK